MENPYRKNDKNDLQNCYMTMKEAAQFLHISISKMQKMSSKREIPIYKPSNGKVYFLGEDLENYMLRGRISSADEARGMIVNTITRRGGAYGTK